MTLQLAATSSVSIQIPIEALNALLPLRQQTSVAYWNPVQIDSKTAMLQLARPTKALLAKWIGLPTIAGVIVGSIWTGFAIGRWVR